ncbi:MAG TPA: amidohydrolase family protein [Spirochaetia bacterium]|nr:amidohydrolase family protein [Spirochaetia bacterium]
MKRKSASLGGAHGDTGRVRIGGQAAERSRDVSPGFVLGGGVVTDGIEVFFENGALRIEGDRIREIGDTEELRGRSDRFIDVKGRMILPGFLNPHQHLYSSLARGLRPVGKTDSFTQQLRNLWWRLDSVLDEESVYYSAILGIIDAVKHGVTMIFDHHASMSFVRGSLAVIKRAFDTAGIKGLLCFETSDRSGEAKVQSHIEENVSFWEMQRSSPNVQGMFGLHANFTLSEDTLRKIEKDKPGDMPIHIHCGEDTTDLYHCMRLGYRGPVDRLHRFSLLDSHSILAHAVHLSPEDYRILHEIDPIVVSNPESNANNQVGRMDREKIERYLLGTDGMSADPLKTLRSHYLLGRGRKESLQELKEVFFDLKSALQQRFFPETGLLTPGRLADITVLDYAPIAPVSLENILPHLLFGAEDGRAFMTVSNGTILYSDGRILFADEDDLKREARIVARSLQERYYG